MPTRIFVDTSFVVALINSRDQYHDRANSLSRRFETTLLLTTSAILLEIGNAMAAAYRREAIAVLKAFRDTNRVEIVEVNETLFSQGLQLYEKYADKTWSLVDCISFVTMRERQLTEVLTFDADFAQAGFMVISA